ncbi:CLUMA_CG002096, isoform A [Clunio marinus]|uniref:CLUMA_CG002096, isoform A n=1 Tax=Clunio marinus TaxID=568069 RepID=A0A1J1HJW6_9DIPT|nr:CLUMA_CG002096, isoform A [Clunio marinus]
MTKKFQILCYVTYKSRITLKIFRYVTDYMKSTTKSQSFQNKGKPDNDTSRSFKDNNEMSFTI